MPRRAVRIQEALLVVGPITIETLGDPLGDYVGKRLDEALVGTQDGHRGGPRSIRDGGAQPCSPSQSTSLPGSAGVRQIAANGPSATRSTSRQTETSTSGAAASSGSA